MTDNELSVMDGSKCILQLRGVRPFLSDKYDITKHKNYRLLSDSNPKHPFNIEKFLSTKCKISPDEAIELHEITATDADMPDAALDDFPVYYEVNDIDDDNAEIEVDLEPF